MSTITTDDLTSTAWTLETAITWLRKAEVTLRDVGWHVALAGGVLFHGKSEHDLDIVVFPHNNWNFDLEDVHVSLLRLNMTQTHTPAQMHDHWAAKGSTDRKDVEVWRLKDGRRVDVILLTK
jgi:hypothetical protein